jgi:hypothetical protein
MPKPFTFLLPVAFVLLLIIGLPLVFGSAEAATNTTALEHNETVTGIFDAFMTGDQALVVVFIVLCVAVAVAMLTFVFRRVR